jgi:uncharacterized protein YgiM (DUF1202 family)
MAEDWKRAVGTQSRRRLRLLVLGVAPIVGLGACSISGGHSKPRSQPTVTTLPPSTAKVPATTAVAAVQTTGPRTVLSPIGLNVRAAPSKSAKVLGTAAQGAVLDVLDHRDAGGGWFKVKGATVTGWISASSALSSPASLKTFTSAAHQFSVLYPSGWTVAESTASVVFRARPGGETVVVSTAANVGQLGRGPSGYRETQSEQVVACGVTSRLATSTQDGATGPAPARYVTQLRLTLDAKHALGIDANLTDLAQLQTVRDFVNALTFPFPQCQG